MAATPSVVDATVLPSSTPTPTATTTVAAVASGDAAEAKNGKVRRMIDHATNICEKCGKLVSAGILSLMSSLNVIAHLDLALIGSSCVQLQCSPHPPYRGSFLSTTQVTLRCMHMIPFSPTIGCLTNIINVCVCVSI
jgi:hypothetical protein